MTSEPSSRSVSGMIWKREKTKANFDMCNRLTSLEFLVVVILIFISFIFFVLQTGLHYYSSLNALQYKRKCSLLEPILGYMHAQRAFFQMGQDAVCKNEIEEFLNNISTSVQG